MEHDNTLAQLLDRWAKAAPEECRRHFNDVMGVSWFLLDKAGQAETRVSGSPSLYPFPALILYHALTCAARRGWLISISYLDTSSEPWYAEFEGNTCETGRSPELAVLTAYVAALEAVRAPETANT